MRMQALIFLTVLATASVVDCRKRIIPDSLCLLTAAAGFVLGFWRGIWGMALGLLLAVLYHCAAALFQKITHYAPSAMARTALPLGPFLSIGFAALFCFGGQLL